MSAHVLERDSRHRYWCVNPEHKNADCAGVIFKSVTNTIKGAVPKDLAWYGQTRGVIGVKGLLKRGYDIAQLSAEAITDALKRERLTVNDHRDERGQYGSALHKALENYAQHGTIPAASSVPEYERPRVRALATFIIEYRPRFVATEVRTVSVSHGFAGTFDILADIGAETYRDDKGLLKLRPAKTVLRALIDLKTGKWVYPAEQFCQLEAYEGARVEAGEPPTDVRAVLWVNADGGMELVPSTATFADFLALKASAEVIGRLDKSWKRPRKAKA